MVLKVGLEIIFYKFSVYCWLNWVRWDVVIGDFQKKLFKNVGWGTGIFRWHRSGEALEKKHASL